MFANEYSSRSVRKVALFRSASFHDEERFIKAPPEKVHSLNNVIVPHNIRHENFPVNALNTRKK